MAICPIGHESGTDDYCEVCGRLMAGVGQSGPGVQPEPPLPPPPPGVSPYPVNNDPEATAAMEMCPQCKTPREGQEPFCEGCRWNFLAGTPGQHLPPPLPQHLPPPFQHAPGAPVQDPYGQAPGQGPAPQGPGPQGPGQDPYGQGPAVQRPSWPGAPQPTGATPPPQADGPAPANPGFPPDPAGQPHPLGPEPGYPPPAPGPGAGPRHSAGPRHGAPQPPPPQPGPGLQPVHQPPPVVQGQPFLAPPAPPPPAPFPGPPQQPGPDPHQGPGHHAAPGPGLDVPAPRPSLAKPSAAPVGGGNDFALAPPGGLGATEEGGSLTPGRPPSHPGQHTSWYVIVSADRDYFTAMMARSGPEAQGLFFPPYCPERRFELVGHQVRIGRVRNRPGEDAPEIDLSRPPEDPGVSHRHAVLVQQPDGAWAVVDQDSTNGTTVNGGEDPIQAHVPVPLREGDRIHLGAWTTVTLHRAGGQPGA